MIKEITIFVSVMVLLFLFLKIIKVKWKLIISVLINTFVGGLVLFLVNYIPGVNVEIGIFNSLCVGIFGLPAVIVILVLYFIS